MTDVRQEAAVTSYVVTGVVSSPSSAAVGNISVKLVDKNVGGDVELAAGTTDAGGHFAFAVSIPETVLTERHKTSPDLQVQAQLGAFTALSIVRYNATPDEELDVTLPDSAPLVSEFESLTADLTALSAIPLTDLEESASRQDITYLANKSGWDARAVAMASLAHQFAGASAQQPAPAHPDEPLVAEPGRAVQPAADVQPTVAVNSPSPSATTPPALQPAHYYALLRAGQPTDATSLHQISPDLAVSVWHAAASQNVIPMELGADTQAAQEAFVNIGAKTALTAPPIAGLSTLGDVLSIQFGRLDPNQQQTFAELLVRYGGDTSTLWTKTESAFGAETASQMQLLGKLSYLTANNAPLIAALYQSQHDHPLTSASDLVSNGYYAAAAWQSLLSNVEPPKEVPGGTLEQQKANYAELLAAQVRVSFPTATVGQLSSTGAFGAASTGTGAGTFLTNNQAFDIGDEPIGQYLSRTGTAAGQEVVQEITRIQRVYQLTQDTTAMSYLLAQGVDSAYAISKMSDAEFLAAHADAVGGADVASRVYARAKSVTASTMHLAVSYLAARRQPSLGSGAFASLASYAGETQASPGTAQATLETLFGDLDYCQCDDCQSITSPAAYLVDLLDWINISTPTAPGQNPLDVLLGRRPDIGTLLLTCDNTTTALPYLDLANEVLEYYVGNPHPETLDQYAGYNDDGTVSSAELIASPQNDDNTVSQSAYAALRAQFYPPPLPFYRDLELLRRHISRFGITLHNLMLALRSTDNLAAPAATPGDPNPYGWNDILIERLGISRPEFQLLTDGTLTLAQLYGTSTLSDLASLREYSRITGVSYSDLVTILETQFINPNSWLIPLLNALPVTYATITQLHANTITAAQFDADVSSVDPTPYGPAGIAAWVLANYDAISSLVVINVAGDPCDTSQMTLQHLDGQPLVQLDFVKLVRFIRLWEKLGLSIEQTDDLISALSTAPAGTSDPHVLDQGFIDLLPRAGLAFQAIDLMGLDPGSDLESLLVCWARIPSARPDSLYAQMFLNPTVLRLDSTFAPDAHGMYFTGMPAPTVLGHQPALMAALNLTGAEFALVTGPAPLGLGFDSSTPLDMDAVSAIYRRAWLARTLGLSLTEFLSLTAYAGVDPFATPTLDGVHPVDSPLIDFATRTQALRNAGLAPVQAMYLLWNQDLSGVSAPSPSVITSLASVLRSDFVAVDSQFAVTGSVTAATAQALMALVVGATAANQFFGLLNGSFSTSVPFGYTQPNLPPAVLTAGNGHLSYDDVTKELSFAGYLDATTVANLQAAAATDASLLAAINALATVNTQAVNVFFQTYDDPHVPYLRPLFDTYVTSTTGAAPVDSATAVVALLSGLLPVLGQLRKQEQALASATAAAGSDPTFAPALLGSSAAISATNPATPGAGVADLTALDQGGLSAEYFLTDDPTAAPDSQVTAIALAYGTDNPLPAPIASATAIAGKWSGYINSPADGDYNISLTVDAGATVTLAIGGNPVALASTVGPSGTVWANTGAIALQAGALSPIEITATGLVHTFTASWQTVGTGWQPIPSKYLYSAVLLGYLETTTLRFLKATSLASDLSLAADEIAYLASAAGLIEGGAGWLAQLAVDAPAAAANYTTLASVLDGLCAYATLKAAYSPLSTKTPQLLKTLQDMSAGASGVASELQALTGWDPQSLQPLLAQLFGVATTTTADEAVAAFAAQPGLLAHLVRLQNAFSIVKQCGLSAVTLIEATTNDPDAVAGSTVLADFQSALRSRFAEGDWLKVVQPINDSLRELQRDALVAYILEKSGPSILSALGIATTPSRLPTVDDLFNYFLLDVEMEPCMLTSRVRLALSAIQLFIERCLRNLEPNVTPSDLDTSQWEWRKRYRVWQANREVFLWPENWLDPSFRDDQTAFFKTTLSQLLQSDIDDDAAVAAYLDYLSNLELVAKLDPCALYYDQQSQTAHVIGRTGGAHRKHFYRKFSNGGWTPWEEVKLNIEDVPMALYVWNGRLLLFWLQIHHSSGSAGSLKDNLPQSAPPPQGQSTKTLADTTVTDLSTSVANSAPGLTKEYVNAALFFSEYYNGSWQPTKSSDVSTPLALDYVEPGTFDRSSWRLRPWLPADPTDESLCIEVTNNATPAVDPTWYDLYFDTGFVEWGSTFGLTGWVLHNTHSEPVSNAALDTTTLAQPSKLKMEKLDSPYKLVVSYAQPNYWSPPVFSDVQVLDGYLPQQVVDAQPCVDDQTTMPFFFRDTRGSFYVTPGQITVPLRWYDGFGLGNTQFRDPSADGISYQVSVPNMVVPVGPPQPDPPVEILSAGVDPASAQDAVAGGSLKAVIPANTAVTFQGRSIGVTGSTEAKQAPASTEGIQ